MRPGHHLGEAVERINSVEPHPAERVGSHGDSFWQDELPLMVAWAFGR